MTEKLTPEQAQLLAHVAQTESTFDTGAIPHDEQGNPIPPEPSIDEAAAENAQILAMAISMLTPAMPFLADCYPPDTINRIAAAYTAVEQKHGWNARQYLSVEVQLLIVALPPTMQAIVIGKAYFAARKAEAERQMKDINPREDGTDGGN